MLRGLGSLNEFCVHFMGPGPLEWEKRCAAIPLYTSFPYRGVPEKGCYSRRTGHMGTGHFFFPAFFPSQIRISGVCISGTWYTSAQVGFPPFTFEVFLRCIGTFYWDSSLDQESCFFLYHINIGVLDVQCYCSSLNNVQQ